jgi:hypothetical protein
MAQSAVSREHPGRRAGGPLPLFPPAGLRDNAAMSEWTMFAVVATIVVGLIALLRMALTDEEGDPPDR